MKNKSEYSFGSKELDGLLVKNCLLLLLGFFSFFIGAFLSNKTIIIIYAIGWSLNIAMIMTINPETETEKEELKWLIRVSKISEVLLFIILLVVGFVGGKYIIEEGLKASDIPLYIFYVINVLDYIIFKRLNICGKSILKKLEDEKKREKKIETVSCNIEGTLKIIEETLNNLDFEEKNILEPCVLKIKDLFVSTYDSLHNIKDCDMFFDIENFILDYSKAIDAYRKSGVAPDLDFLKKLNSSAEEFYNNINSKEQVLRKSDFESKMDILKIKLKQVY